MAVFFDAIACIFLATYYLWEIQRLSDITYTGLYLKPIKMNLELKTRKVGGERGGETPLEFF